MDRTIAAAAQPLDSRAWEQCVASLHRELGRIASREDCQDAVQDALAEALSRPELSVENLGGWALVIARRRLLDRHRAAVGRSRRRRRRFVSIDDVEPGDRIGERELVELLEDGASREASETLQRLGADEQRLLTLALERVRYADVAEVFGISPKAAKERTRRAWAALRQAFIDTELEPACGDARRLMVARRPRGSVGEAQRRVLLAHVEGCAPCRAYQKRLKGLIATSPAPSLPFWQQLLLRLDQFLAGTPGPRSVESAAGALSSGQGGAIARMVAALCATATAAVCAALVAAPGPSSPRPEPPRASSTPVGTPVRATAVVTSTTTPTATATPKPVTRKRTRRSAAADGVTGNRARDTRSVTKPRPAAAPAGSTSTSEFTPSGAGSGATAPPAPAPEAGGGEFRP